MSIFQVQYDNKAPMGDVVRPFLTIGAAVAMALWTVHCHCYSVFRFTPRLQFKSPTKGAGKSTAIELLRIAVAKPLEPECDRPKPTIPIQRDPWGMDIFGERPRPGSRMGGPSW
jgi:hypothetical protein